MPRLASDLRHEVADEPGGVDDASSAARLVAVAITILLVSFLVLARSDAALDGGVASSADLRVARVALTDDDEGRTLFDLPDLAPGESHQNCIAVTYTGVEFDAVVRLHGRGGGPLAPYLELTVERGDGGGFGDCDDFEPEAELFDGNLRDFQDTHRSESTGLDAFATRTSPQAQVFRVTFSLSDEASLEDYQGLEASAEFLWSLVA